MTTVTKPKSKKSNQIHQLGDVHINAGFNNIIITVTTKQGQTLCWSTAGKEGFKGSRKSTPFAATSAAESAAKTAAEKFGMKKAVCYIKGTGSGREAAIRAFHNIVPLQKIIDITAIAFGGCRPRKARRV